MNVQLPNYPMLQRIEEKKKRKNKRNDRKKIIIEKNDRCSIPWIVATL